MDSQGFVADLTVTGVTTNRAAATCKCRPPKQNCSCVPEVVLLNATTMQFMQQARLPGKNVGRAFLITYTARVAQTNRTAVCTAQLCAITGGSAQKPPQCAPFNSSGIQRNAFTPVCPVQVKG